MLYWYPEDGPDEVVGPDGLYDDDDVPLGPLTWWDIIEVMAIALGTGAIGCGVLWTIWTMTH